MQWYNNKNKYNLNKNWIKLSDNYKIRNVEDQINDSESILIDIWILLKYQKF